MDDRRVRRFPLVLFGALSAVILAAVFLFVRQVLQDTARAGRAERDQRLIQEFESRLASRIDSARLRLQGAELLIAATPPSARVAARALAFALNEGAGGAHLASVVLDEQGKILASRRRGGVPPAGEAERAAWARAAGRLRLQDKQGKAGSPRARFHIEAGTLQGVPVVYFTIPAPSTKGFWGIILAAENLIPAKGVRLGPRESVFLLTEPEQSVLYARQGNKFLVDAVATTFEKRLASELQIPICCDPEAFNALHEGERSMAQAAVPGGTRELRLVVVTARRRAGPSPAVIDRYLGGGAFAAWVLLVAVFAFFASRSRVPAPLLSEAEEKVGGQEPAAGAPATPGQIAGLSRLSELIGRGESFREVIEMAAQEGTGFLRAPRHYAGLYDEGLGQLFEIVSAGLGEAYRGAVAMGNGDLPERIAIRERDIVEVTSLDEWEEAPNAMREEGVKACIVFPLWAEERVIGVMAYYFDEPRELASEEVDYCILLARQAAISVAWALSLPQPQESPESPESPQTD